ncbi:MAG: enoyl-CoA hydratase-related protein [Syntrophomonadaceae bacterium]|jgi:enoyl-CoA hydratase/carnithine racemase|nr:enoyl-CoA hydratase-related protein [Syntrophomonadaceae bacterium]MDH7497125.1 enoyl-CoA hydratase-related protein [Syntrophomonadaceae bacterium]
MANDAVVWSQEGAVCTVTMNRPAAMNAMNDELVKGLQAAFDACRDDSVRAVVLTGAGKAFCLGGDLNFADQYGAGDRAAFFREFPHHLTRLIAEMRRLPKPIIASVNGVAAGVGLSLAAACDLRIASARAVFKQAYTSVALAVDGGWSQMVPLLVGLGKATEMLFLDEVMSAEEALRCGLVNRVVPAEELADATAALAQRLANGPTRAFAEVKQLLNKSMLPFLEVQLEAERQAMVACSLTEDYLEGFAVFNGKKNPEFKGK